MALPSTMSHAVPGRQALLWEENVWRGRGGRVTGTCPMHRDLSEEVKVWRSGMRSVARFPPRALVIFGSRLQPGPTSGFIALLQPQSVLMSMVPESTYGQNDMAVQLSPPFTECKSCPSSAEALRRESCASPGQQTRADPVHRGKGELALRT